MPSIPARGVLAPDPTVTDEVRAQRRARMAAAAARTMCMIQMKRAMDDAALLAAALAAEQKADGLADSDQHDEHDVDGWPVRRGIA